MANLQLNELVDYIKKARQAGQQDQQTRQILLKNGWSNAEADEAFASLNSQPQIQARPQPQVQPQARPAQPEPAKSPAGQLGGPATISPSASLGGQPAIDSKKFRRGGGRLFVLKLILSIILILVVISAGVFGFYALSNINVVEQNNPPAEPEQEQQEVEIPQNLISKNLALVPQEYDAAKAFIAFSDAGDKTIYCAPLKTNSKKITCFENNQKLFDIPYAFKPYWIGVSPNGQRIIMLFYDSAKKKSFAFENGQEGPRYDGKMVYPAFSKDSQSFLFMVMANNNKNFVVLNDRPFAFYDKIFPVPQFSSDGKYIFYGARSGENILWVVDSLSLPAE